jgi:hypothetical protein
MKKMKKKDILKIINFELNNSIPHNLGTCRLMESIAGSSKCGSCPLSMIPCDNKALLKLAKQHVLDCKIPAVFLDIKRIQKLIKG